jgi:hypothetical protein
MLAEPLADVDVNVPGVMAILVAPVVTQLNVLFAPGFTLVGFAANEVIVGMDPFPEDELEELDNPQFTRPRQASKTIITRASVRESGPEELNRREPR